MKFRKRILSIFICSVLLVSNCMPTLAADNSHTTAIKFFNVARPLIKTIDGNDLTHSINGKAINEKFNRFIADLSDVDSSTNTETQNDRKTLINNAREKLKNYVIKNESDADVESSVSWILSPSIIALAYNKALFRYCYNLLKDPEISGGHSIESGPFYGQDLSNYGITNEDTKNATYDNKAQIKLDNIETLLEKYDDTFSGFNRAFTQLNKNVGTAYKIERSNDSTSSYNYTATNGEIGAEYHWTTGGTSKEDPRVEHYKVIIIKPHMYKDNSKLTKQVDQAGTSILSESNIAAINSSKVALHTLGVESTTDAQGRDSSTSEEVLSFNYPISSITIQELKENMAKYTDETISTDIRKDAADKIYESGVFTHQSTDALLETGGVNLVSSIDREFVSAVTNINLLAEGIITDNLPTTYQQYNRDYIVQYANLPIAGIRIEGVDHELLQRHNSAIQAAKSKGYMDLHLSNGDIKIIQTVIQIDRITGIQGTTIQTEETQMFYNFEDGYYYKLGSLGDINDKIDGIDATTDTDRKKVSAEYDITKSFTISKAGHMLCLEYYPLYKNEAGAELPIGRKVFFDAAKINYSGDGAFALTCGANDVIAYLPPYNSLTFTKDGATGLKAADFGAASGLGEFNTRETEEDEDITDTQDNPMSNNAYYHKHVYGGQRFVQKKGASKAYLTNICAICGGPIS